jgi:5-methylcytosine-specific restriction endonuclease McrA
MAAGTRYWREQCAARVRAERRPCWLHAHGLCKYNGAPIDYTARFPHPRSFSADHIIPTNAGGRDTYRNCGASHLRCNTARHDQLIHAAATNDVTEPGL